MGLGRKLANKAKDAVKQAADKVLHPDGDGTIIHFNSSDGGYTFVTVKDSKTKKLHQIAVEDVASNLSEGDEVFYIIHRDRHSKVKSVHVGNIWQN